MKIKVNGEEKKIELEKKASMLWETTLGQQRRSYTQLSNEEFTDVHVWYISVYRYYLEEYAPNDEQYRKWMETVMMNPSDFVSSSLREQERPTDSNPD